MKQNPFLLFGTGLLIAGAGTLAHAVEPSPFVAGGGAAASAATPDGTSFELRGIMSTPDGVRYCIYDPGKKTSQWVGLNEAGHPFSVLSADANSDSVDLKGSDGRKLSLTMRKGKVMALGSAVMPMQPQGNFMQGGQTNLSQPITAPVVLKPTPEDEQRRLQAIADEVRRRRLLREQQQNGMAPQPPPPPPSG